MPPIFAIESNLDARACANLFAAAGFPRPDERLSLEQVERMIGNSNLIATARDGGNLIGVALAMSNGVTVCFLASIAVLPGFSGKGVGAGLVRALQSACGGDTMSLVTVATDASAGFYEEIGMERARNAFIKLRRPRAKQPGQT
jgi:N-acetylglutamate synthase-like GNAT family acetyltransferase